MNAAEVIKNHIVSNGIKLSFLSEKSGVNYELLRRSLDGDRVLKADELLSIIAVLKIDFNTFHESPASYFISNNPVMEA